MPRPIALITGASAGLGSTFASRLAPTHDLVLVARTADRLEQLAKELNAQHGTESEVLPVDLAADPSPAEARLHQGDRPVDMLINNAGFGTFGEFGTLPLEEELREIQLNVVALVRLTHAAIVPMVGRARGTIINVSSVAGFQPGPYEATYGATKAFVTSFTQAIHEEVRGRGVRVLALCPGFTRTEFQERGGVPASQIPGALWQSAEQVVDAALAALPGTGALCIPGAHNKAAVVLAHVAPPIASRRLAGYFGKRLSH
jgi:short-subunit dehydrogenase